MKVIHLIGGGDTGGAKTHVYSLLTYLGQVVDVRLVCFRKGRFADEAQALGIPTMVMQHNVLWCVAALQKLIRDEGYQFVHCHGAKANVIGAMLRPLVGVPVLHQRLNDYIHMADGALYDVKMKSKNDYKVVQMTTDFRPSIDNVGIVSEEFDAMS